MRLLSPDLTPMTRICFVGFETLAALSREHNQHGIGGEQVQHSLLAKAFSRRGHQVSIACLDYGQRDGMQVDGISIYKTYRESAGLPVVRFVAPRLTGLWSAMKRANADVYYASCAGMHLGIVAAFSRRYGRRSCFRIAHDTDCDPRHLLVKYRRDRWLYEFGLRHTDRILAQSEQQQEALKRNYGLESVVAGMLVEPQTRDIAMSGRDIDVLWVNNLRPFKRPDLALDLARRLPGYSIHMVGGPQPGHEAMFEQVALEAKSLGNLTFHGRVPYHDVNDLYERAKVFVNTSDSEGFPNSYLQAWRRGTPVVAFFDPDGIIAKHDLGHAAGSIDDMVKAVASLLTQPDRWQQHHDGCQRFMNEHFGDEQILAPYRRAFDAPLRGIPAATST